MKHSDLKLNSRENQTRVNGVLFVLFIAIMLVIQGCSSYAYNTRGRFTAPPSTRMRCGCLLEQPVPVYQSSYELALQEK